MLKPVAALSAAIMMSGTALAQDVLFSYGGKDYQLSDLQPELQQRYFDNLQEAREKNLSLLDQAVLDIYIDKLAASQNKSVVEVREQLFKVEPISDDEVKTVYEQYQGQIGMPFEQVKEQLRQRMEAMKAQEGVLALIDEAKEKNGFTVKIPASESPTFLMDLTPFPYKGASNPKLTIVEVADYRCPYCKVSSDAVMKLMDKYGDDVRLYYVDLNVVQPASGISVKVMEGAYCARQQDKYWEYNKAAYAMQSDLSLESPVQLAEKLGLNKQTFEACLTSDAAKAYVAQSQQFARSYGVSGTPTFFVNGKRLHSHDPEADLKAMIEKAL
ncbi:DsbA family protein [Parendozoicomonas haliclonae]|uniref:Disulfide bond formation protein D n=1 Tax=Parendozoicomonas haliclonae TaxID=1960125 RepID=A0A1X7AR24_9GAMM|nr:thioredoxin domain-containing protein [Parendozoicomonas haliclonae]SMA50582.1 Disulfide bond formation protein D precursor [Parendozoicomonas haliclonae]